MRRPHILVPFLVLVVLGSAPVGAQNDAPPQADTARGGERYVIEPGAEPLFAEMLGKGETLPGGCTLSDGKIEATSVLATYACGEAQAVLELVHPERAKPGAVLTRRFAVGAARGTAPDGLVDGVAERIRAHEAAFQWKDVSRPDGPGIGRWPVAVGVGIVAAVLLFQLLRRRRTS